MMRLSLFENDILLQFALHMASLWELKVMYFDENENTKFISQARNQLANTF